MSWINTMLKQMIMSIDALFPIRFLTLIKHPSCEIENIENEISNLNLYSLMN